MNFLLCLTFTLLLAATECWSADLITVLDFDREIDAEAVLDFGDPDLDSDEFAADTTTDLYPWVSGVVADLFHSYGEVISVADQNSFATSGPTTGTVHMQGFVSATTISGGIDAYNYVAPTGFGGSDLRLKFRVEQPVDYILSGTIWSSVDPGDGLGCGIAGVTVQVEFVPGAPFLLDVEGDQITFQETGTLYPGVTYDISFYAWAEADADFDILTTTGRDYYGAAGCDMDLFLSPSASPVSDQLAPGLNVTSHPNPFCGSTHVQLAAPRDVLSTVSIFDVRGRLLRQWDDVPGGGAPFAWDGRGRDGRAVAAGTYFLRAESGREFSQHKLVRVR
jgi:hypothetical protein